MFSLCTAITGFAISRPLDLGELIELVPEYKIKPLAKQSLATFGWAPPLPELPDQFVFDNGHYLLLRWQAIERIIPPKSVKKEVEAKVKKMEEEGLPVSRKIKQQLMEEAVTELMTKLPDSFVNDNSTYVILQKAEPQRIYVLTTVQSQVDTTLAYLRKTIGSLPVEVLRTANPVGPVLAEWIRAPSSRPDGMTISGHAVLQSLHDKTQISCKDADLESQQIIALMDNIDLPMFPVALTTQWSDIGSFVIATNDPRAEYFVIKGIKFSSEFRQKAAENSNAEDRLAEFDASFFLCTTTITLLIDTLLSAMSSSQAQPGENK